MPEGLLLSLRLWAARFAFPVLAVLLRLGRVLAATLVCGLLFVYLRILIERFGKPAFPAKSLEAAYFVFWMSMPRWALPLLDLALIAFALDRLRLRQIPVHVALWAGAGALVILRYEPDRWLMYLIGAVVGLAYWALAGRVAGRTGFRAREVPARSLVAKAAIGAFCVYAAFILAGWLILGGKMVWVSVYPPSPGEPPFPTRSERQMTGRMKVAMMDFPDAQSCVAADAGPVLPGKLVPLDWSRIAAPEEEVVCIFRLLATNGDVAMSEQWFRGLGFRMRWDDFRQKGPYVGSDGKQRVVAQWSVWKNGPRYPVRTLLLRGLAAQAQGVSISAVWSSDGKTLLGVEIDGMLR